MAIAESGEMYLETIRILQEKTGHVRSTDIAEYMGYSKPSVSRAVGLLKNGGFIQVEKDGGILLTESGLSVADKILERHTLLTQLLVMLGVDARIASEDACKMEHAISDTSFEAIKQHLAKHQK